MLQAKFPNLKIWPMNSFNKGSEGLINNLVPLPTCIGLVDATRLKGNSTGLARMLLLQIPSRSSRRHDTPGAKTAISKMAAYISEICKFLWSSNKVHR